MKTRLVSSGCLRADRGSAPRFVRHDLYATGVDGILAMQTSRGRPTKWYNRSMRPNTAALVSSDFSGGILHAIRTGYHVPSQTQTSIQRSIVMDDTIVLRPTTTQGRRVMGLPVNAMEEKSDAVPRIVARRPTTTPKRWHPRQSPRQLRRPATVGRPDTSVGGGKDDGLRTRTRKPSFDYTLSQGWDIAVVSAMDDLADISNYAKNETERQQELAKTSFVRNNGRASSSEEDESLDEDEFAEQLAESDASSDDDGLLDCDTFGDTDVLTGRARSLVHGSHSTVAQRTYKRVFADTGHAGRAINKRVAEHLLREDCVLRNRGLDEEDALAMAECLRLNQTVQYLDVSTNAIGPQGAKEIVLAAISGETVRHLNMNAVRLGTNKECALAVASAFAENKTICTLSLQANDLKDYFLETLCLAFQKNGTQPLTFLDVGRNLFSSAKSLTALAETCASGNATTLSQLSLAWNNLRIAGPVFVDVLCSKISEIKLVALDMSYCGLGDNAAVPLGTFLSTSKSITSLDVSHNRLYRNSATVIADGLKRNRTIQNLHIGFNKLEEEGTMELIHATKSAVKLKHLGIENTVVHVHSDGGDDPIQRVFEAGMTIIKGRKTALSIAVEFPPKHRHYKEREKTVTVAAVAQKWTLPKSVFAPRIKDADSKDFYDFTTKQSALLLKCIAADFKRTKIENVVKDEAELRKVKLVLTENYANIVEVFRYYSAAQLVGSDPFFMTMTTFGDVCEAARLYDGETFNTSDADRTFIAANVERTDLKTVPSSLKGRNTIKYMCRYEWLEALVRIAIRKFVESKLEANVSSGLVRLLEEHIFPFCQYTITDDWRSLRLYNEACDGAVRDHLDTILTIYKKYSGKKNNPSERKCMSLDEWMAFVDAYHLQDDDFTEREQRAAFAFSVPLVVDELHKTKALPDQLTLVTFIECLARSVELMDPSRVTKVLPNVFAGKTAFIDSSVGAPPPQYDALHAYRAEADLALPYPGSAFWISNRTLPEKCPTLHLCALMRGLLKFVADATKNMDGVRDKMAAAKNQVVNALPLDDTLDAIAALYEEKVAIAEDEGRAHHHTNVSMAEFCVARLSDFERRQLQLSLVEHQHKHSRVFWFGIITGWISDTKFEFDQRASSSFFDILTHVAGTDDIQRRFHESGKTAGDLSEFGFVPTEAVEANVMRLCGDVVPDEDLLQQCYTEITAVSKNNRFFSLGKQRLRLDEALVILMTFWYEAVLNDLD